MRDYVQEPYAYTGEPFLPKRSVSMMKNSVDKLKNYEASGIANP